MNKPGNHASYKHLPPGLVTAKQAAEYLGVHYNTFMPWAKAGHIPSVVYLTGPSNEFRAFSLTDLNNFKLGRVWRAYAGERKKRAQRTAQRRLEREQQRLTPAEEMAAEHAEELARAYKNDAADLKRRAKAI